MTKPVLTVRNLSIINQATSECLVESLSYELTAGQTLAIVGESGSGKSISSLALLGLLPANLQVTGSAFLFNDTLATGPKNLPIANPLAKANQSTWQQVRGEQIGMIFQEPMTALNPLHTVGKQIGESLIKLGVAKKR